MNAKNVLKGGLLLLGALLACQTKKDSKDLILAQVGMTKIMKSQVIQALVGEGFTPEAAEALFAEESKRAERDAFLDQYLFQQKIFLHGDEKGLASDGKVKRTLELAKAKIYVTALLEKTIPEPTDQELLEAYNKAVAGQPKERVRPFGEVKAQLKPMVKEKKSYEAFMSLKKQLDESIPVIYSQGFSPQGRSAGQQPKP